MKPLNSKQNCWEYMHCGRQPGGARVHELGICPATVTGEFDGINSGVNGGRICWAVPRTICDNGVHGTFSLKIMTCIRCPFFLLVKAEEGVFNFQLGLDEMK